MISIWQKPMMAAFACLVRAKISFFLKPGLRGPHQFDNAGLAAACLFDLAAKSRLPSRSQTKGKCVFQRHSIGCLARAGAVT